MSTVTIPDDLAALLRAHEHDEGADLDALVLRALTRYMCLTREHRLSAGETARLVREAEELEAAIARAGISEEELGDHFEQWRRRQPADLLAVIER